MKRLTLLAVALTMVLGMAASAVAAPEVTISGNMLVNAVWRSNWDFNDGNGANIAGEDDPAFTIQERLNLAFTAVANENLKGVIVLRSQRGSWGQGNLANGSGGASGGGGGVFLGLNQAYIDFNWPGTSINAKIGFQPVALPAAVGGGSMIQDDIATAAMVSTNLTDGVDLLVGWARFNDTADTATTYAAGVPTFGNDVDDAAIDAFILALPLSFEGFAAGPFFVYAPLGENANATAATLSATSGGYNNAGLLSVATVADIGGRSTKVDGAYWVGSSFEMSMLDPFILKADINYGAVDGENEFMDRSGWLFDIALEYTGFDFMNLEAVFAYSTGEDDDSSNGSERMPVLSDSWALGSFWFGGGLITNDDIGSTDANLGFWALALSATGIQSFAEGLTHDAHIVYARGTNDDRSAGASLGGVGTNQGVRYGRSLTDEDDMLEIDFNTMYKVYDELTLYNGIGYINLDTDDSANVWGNGFDGGDAWKFQIGAVYQF